SRVVTMGRFGPAFRAYPNFDAFREWNASLVYATTAAYLATRLAGAPRVHPGSGTPPTLTGQQVLELQNLLQRQGYDIGGKADGKLRLATPAGAKQAQLQVGRPADSYPTAELIVRLRGGTGSASAAPASAPRATGTTRPKAPGPAPSRPRPPGQ